MNYQIIIVNPDGSPILTENGKAVPITVKVNPRYIAIERVSDGVDDEDNDEKRWDICGGDDLKKLRVTSPDAAGYFARVVAVHLDREHASVLYAPVAS